MTIFLAQGFLPAMNLYFQEGFTDWIDAKAFVVRKLMQHKLNHKEAALIADNFVVEIPFHKTLEDVMVDSGMTGHRDGS